MRRNEIAKARGFSLIEILVAMLLLVIGVLGAVAMQLNSLKYSQTSSSRTQATFLAYTMIDMMRANYVAAVANSYNINVGDTAVDNGTAASKDLVAWQTMIKNQLVGGSGAVLRQPQVNGAGQPIDMVTVTLQWDESRVGGNSDLPTGNGINNTQQFVFTTQL